MSLFQLSTTMSESSLRVIVLPSLVYSYFDFDIEQDEIRKPLFIKQETEWIVRFCWLLVFWSISHRRRVSDRGRLFRSGRLFFASICHGIFCTLFLYILGVPWINIFNVLTPFAPSLTVFFCSTCSMLRRHESHLSIVAMSNSEAAHAVAACLSELSPHRKASSSDSNTFIWALER